MFMGLQELCVVEESCLDMAAQKEISWPLGRPCLSQTHGINLQPQQMLKAQPEVHNTIGERVVCFSRRLHTDTALAPFDGS